MSKLEGRIDKLEQVAGELAPRVIVYFAGSEAADEYYCEQLGLLLTGEELTAYEAGHPEHLVVSVVTVPWRARASDEYQLDERSQAALSAGALAAWEQRKRGWGLKVPPER